MCVCSRQIYLHKSHPFKTIGTLWCYMVTHSEPVKTGKASGGKPEMEEREREREQRACLGCDDG